MIKLRRYYSFHEFLDTILSGTEAADYYAAFKAAQTNSDDPLLQSQVYSEDFEEVFNNLVMGYRDWKISYEDYVVPFDERPEELDYDDDKDIIEEVLRKFAWIYQNTQERYTVLAGLYAANKTNLLNKITTATTTRYNDTPQNGGDWSDDNHTTNITHATSETDIAPVIERLDEITKKYRNLLKDWADEFKGIFILPEVNKAL